MIKIFVEEVKLVKDILRGVNATIWGGVEQADKVGRIVKTGGAGADIAIGTGNAIKDFACADVVCATLSLVGSASSAAGLVLGNIPGTKHLTIYTGSITVCCRTIRAYCKKSGSPWGCPVLITTIAGKTVKKVILITLDKVNC